MRGEAATGLKVAKPKHKISSKEGISTNIYLIFTIEKYAPHLKHPL